VLTVILVSIVFLINFIECKYVFFLQMIEKCVTGSTVVTETVYQ
jgi:hypothetical protein